MSGYIPEAYSKLGLILARRNVSVLGLQRKLTSVGVSVNIKSLYRLADDAPLQKVDLHIAAAICKVCEVELGDLISFERPKARLRHLDAKIQSRLEALMTKNNDGQLTAAEQKEFATLADEAHHLSMENARTLLAERRRAGKHVALTKKSAGPKRPALTA